MKFIKFFGIVLMLLISLIGVNAITNTSLDVAYWKLDNGKTDATGNGYTLVDGSTAPSFTTSPAIINYSGVFTGTTDYFTTGLDYTDFSGQVLSFAFWVRFNDVTPATNEYVYGSSGGGSADAPFFRIDTAGTLSYGVRGATSQVAKVGLSTSLSANTWYHFVMSYDGKTLRLFKDGVLIDDSVSGTAGTYSFPTMWLGSRSDVPTQDLTGYLDEVFIVNYNLTSDNVSDLYGFNITQIQYPFGSPAPAKSLTIDNISLVDNTITNNSNLNVLIDLINVSTNGDVNTTLYLGNGSSYQIGTNTLNVNYTLSSIAEGYYNFSTFSFNNETNVTSSNYSYLFDYTAPNISIIGPIVQDFLVNFSQVFNVTDALSGLASCTLNATYLENVTNASQYNRFANCTDSVSFGGAGVYEGYLIATDNAGNVETLRINGTIQPFVYVNFFNETSGAISNYDYTLFHPDGQIDYVTNTSNPVNISPYHNGSLDLGDYIIEFSKLGYDTLNVTIPINETSGGITYNFTIPGAKIFFEFINLEDGSYIEGGNTTFVNIIGDGYSTSISTTNRNYTLQSLEIVSDTYQILVSNANYEAVNTLLTFTNQEELNFTIYMTPTTPDAEVVADVIVEVVDTSGSIQKNIPVYQYIWDTDLLQDVLVNQKETASNGQTSFIVFLDTRSYTFCAEYNNQLFCEEDEVIGVNTDKVIVEIDTAVLTETQPSNIYDVDFPFSLTNTTNSTSNTSLILFTWTNSAQDVDNYCLIVYERVNSQDISRYDACSTQHSANLGYTADLSTENLYTADAYIILDGERRIIDSLTINSQNVLQDATEQYGFHKLIALVLFILGLVIGLSKKVHNVTISHIGVSLAYLFISILFPSLFGLDIFFVIVLLNASAVLLYTKRDDLGSKPAIRNLLSILFLYLVMIFSLNFLLADFDDRGLLDSRGSELYDYLNNAQDGKNTELQEFLDDSESQVNLAKDETSPSGEDKTDNTLTTFIKLVAFVDTFFILLSKIFSIPSTIYYMLGYTTPFLTTLMLYINWLVNIILVKVFYDSIWGK